MNTYFKKTMKQIYNWGIVGLGKIAHQFALDILKTENANLWAVASRSKQKAINFADEFNVPNAYGSYNELVDCKDLDVVYIATPHSFHCENTILFLDHGIPVLCEKPLAINSRQVSQMILASRGRGVFLMEAMWTRFLPMINNMLKLIMEDTIGDVVNIKADFGFKANFNASSRLFDPKLGGGALLDVGIYPVFLSLLLLGEPNNIIAKSDFASTGVDEYCKIVFEYEDNKTAFLNCSITENTPTIAEIYGTKGMITLQSRWHESNKLTVKLLTGETRDYEFEYNGKGYNFEMIEVMKCLTNGKLESNFMSLEFSRKLINLLDKVREKTGITYPEDNISTSDISFQKIYNN